MKGYKEKITEDNLIDEFRAGNKAALNYIYEAYSGALYGTIIKITGNEEQSRDLLQEAFVKIWKKADNYDPSKGALYTWMINLTRNLCIDYLRSKRFKNTQKNQALDNHVYSLESNRRFDPQHIGLNELLKRLPDEQQQVIYFSYFQGYTQKEISEELDIPLGTVKSRAKAALEKLKRVFN
ncbi:MAG: sigma-70 family RNA polymerase sigma factor [Owenweeksia sp.]